MTRVTPSIRRREFGVGSLEQTLVDEHISEEALELYAMGRLGDPQAAELEEHILFCTDCQEALERVDDFILAFRVAAPQVQAERHEPESAWKRFWKWVSLGRENLRGGIWVPAAATLAVAVAVIVTPVSMREPAIESVRLESARGEAGMASVKAGNRLHMNLDTRGLPELTSYRVELVDGNGAQVWGGTAKLSAQGLAITTDKSVSPGQYWIRVYDTRGELLREFGVRAAQ